jgi:glucose-1-phosphate thymidylyltransferase
MAGAHVENSSLDRTVVFPDATVVDADVSDSILDEKSSVEELTLANSLLGQHTQVRPE